MRLRRRIIYTGLVDSRERWVNSGIISISIGLGRGIKRFFGVLSFALVRSLMSDILVCSCFVPGSLE